MRRAVSRTQPAQPGGFDLARVSEAGCHTLRQTGLAMYRTQ